MLKKKAVNKDWDKIMGPYWASLPPQGTIHTKETYPRDSLDLLQDGSMVHHPLILGSPAFHSPHQYTGLHAYLFVLALQAAAYTSKGLWNCSAGLPPPEQVRTSLLAYTTVRCACLFRRAPGLHRACLQWQAMMRSGHDRDGCPTIDRLLAECRQHLCGCIRTSQRMCCAGGSLTL